MTETELFAAKFEEQKKETAGWFLMGDRTKGLIAKWFGFGYTTPKSIFVYTWIHPWSYSYEETCTCIIRANTKEEAAILFSATEPDIKFPDVRELSILGDSAVIYNN